MAKIKSVKFYNFTPLLSTEWVTLNMQFFDSNENLVLLDFSNFLSNPSGTYNEIDQCIVTANDSYNSSYYPGFAFHTGNTNKYCGFGKIGNGVWNTKFNTNPWIKIEFKFPQNFSDIKICNSFCPTEGFDTCYYDIEYDDNIIETYNYISNGQFAQKDFRNYDSWTQEEMEIEFDSLEFSKSKQIYDSEIGYVETLDTNNFRNIPVNAVEKLKVLYTKSSETLMSCIVSFDQKQTWKLFNGTNWVDIADNSAQNIILNCMDIEKLNQLDKNKLIVGGFTGDLDFKIAMKSNDTDKTPSITKIYIEYK